MTGRRYEIASWLQEMGTLEDTSLADAGTSGKTAERTTAVFQKAQETSDSQTTEETDGTARTEADEQSQEDKETENELAGLKRMLESLRTQRKASSASVKRTLPYSYQKVSGAIRGAKTIMQASNALSKANATLNQVKRQAATGKYSDEEVNMAKSHARKMVRVARSKLRNLKAEGLQKQDGDQAENQAEQKMSGVVSQVHEQVKIQAESRKDREMAQLSKEIQRTEKQYQNKHRREENWELTEADMEYLRRLIEYLKNQQGRQESLDASGSSTGMTLYGSGTVDASAGTVQNGQTKIFTESGQSVILEQEGTVTTTAEGNGL